MKWKAADVASLLLLRVITGMSMGMGMGIGMGMGMVMGMHITSPGCADMMPAPCTHSDTGELSNHWQAPDPEAGSRTSPVLMR